MRIFPLTPSAAQAAIVSSGTLADLTAPQQALVQEGSFVTTSDGKRWQYKGTGDKTLAASYILISDETPEWSTIENKPTLAFQTFTFSGDSSSTVFNVAGLADNNPSNTFVWINGVGQEPGTDYQVNATAQTVTMSSAVETGDKLVITTLGLVPVNTTGSIDGLTNTSVIDGGVF